MSGTDTNMRSRLTSQFIHQLLTKIQRSTSFNRNQLHLKVQDLKKTKKRVRVKKVRLRKTKKSDELNSSNQS